MLGCVWTQIRFTCLSCLLLASFLTPPPPLLRGEQMDRVGGRWRSVERQRETKERREEWCLLIAAVTREAEVSD